MRQTLTFTNRVHLPFRSQPLRHGIPWPRGAVRADTAITATDESGRPVPAATRVLNLWPDGSVQWSLLDLAVDLEPSATRVVTVEAGGNGAPSAPANPITLKDEPRGVTVGNGLTSFTVLTATGATLVDSWEAGELDALITGDDGAVYSAARCRNKKVWVEDANAVRATVRVEGKHEAADGRTLLNYWVRFVVTADRRDVKVTYHYHNLEDREPGIDLRSMALELRTRMPANAQRAIVHGSRGRKTQPEPYRLSEDFEICSSNTMDLETYPQTHKGITGGGAGRVFIRQLGLLRDDPMKRPWFLRNIVDFKFQSKDIPDAYVWSHLGLVSDRGSLVVAGGNMIGMHPKSLSITGSVVRYAIWPEWAGTMDVTQGEGRTLDLFVGPLPGGATDMEILNQYFSWEFGGLYSHWAGQSTIQTSIDAAHTRRCGVFHVDKLPEYQPGERFAFERKVKALWAPEEPAPANGHWHYGDVFYRWDIGANNEEMAGHQWFQEYLRTGRSICRDRGVAQAQHILDVDICAHSADPYQNGGMCAHGPRHNHCAAYPSHMWFTELLFAYALTGDEEFKKGAARVCDNLVFWVNDPAGFEGISADGRESGQPLINLTWTYEFVPEQRYLDAMWRIIRGSFMDRVKRHGSLVYMKPREDFPLIRFASYGEWAAWEGMFYVWELTRDDELRRFILSQLDWRLKEELMNTSGIFRDTDFNAAAYAFHLTGDRQWLDRVARPFRTIFRAGQWPLGYIKAMYFIKLAFEHGIVKDDDVQVS